jgi:hypothetical protein
MSKSKTIPGSVQKYYGPRYDLTVKDALLAACKFALEYLEANDTEYGAEPRIKACREAISMTEGFYNV